MKSNEGFISGGLKYLPSVGGWEDVMGVGGRGGATTGGGSGAMVGNGGIPRGSWIPGAPPTWPGIRGTWPGIWNTGVYNKQVTVRNKLQETKYRSRPDWEKAFDTEFPFEALTIQGGG